MKRLRDIFHLFPVQLLILHLKKNQALLLFWLVLVAMMTGWVGEAFGIKYLFLGPEYLGEVNFFSFFLLGIAMAAFTMSWNTSSYMLNSFRIPFLATSTSPFGNFCINNAILPLIFITIYIIEIIGFQSDSELKSPGSVFIDVLGFVSGFALWMLIVTLYYRLTNKNIDKVLGKRKGMDKA